MKPISSIYSFFFLFLLFNLCFFGSQLVFHFCNHKGFTNAIALPWAVYFELIRNLFTHLILYGLLSMLQTWMLLGILKRSWNKLSSESWQIIIWSLTVCALLSANAYLFPLSVFSELLNPIITPSTAIYFLIIALLGLSFIALNALFYRSSLIVALILLPCLYLFNNNSSSKITSPLQQPNVIIIGIDSLSPDGVTAETTPFLYKLLQESTQFSNAISPLARTSPAWYSMLTGLYAKHHFAYENLVNKQTLNNKASILWQLNSLGYYTVFATDDRRFNEIDELLGFKKIIGPKIGVNDFLLGTFNDFPLSNLLVNLPISSVLFPYNFSNRASIHGYYPQSFDKYLIKQLTTIPRENPVFFAVHFALPHWPYAWAETLPEQAKDVFSSKNHTFIYQSALKRADRQAKSIFEYLKKEEYFNNSMFIILSDHGETLYEPNSRLTNLANYQGKGPSRLAEYFKQNNQMDMDKSIGHGSDILSPRQYQSILGFKIYQQGLLKTKSASIAERVALIDIAPTVLSYLKVPADHEMDGISLLPSIMNPQISPARRTFFLESGMMPNQILSVEKVIAIGKEYYQVNPVNDELEIKPSKIENINKQKLYGAINGDWIFALYPFNQTHIPVIQNLKTGQWTDDINDAFAQSSPVLQLSEKLHGFYGKQLKTH